MFSVVWLITMCTFALFPNLFDLLGYWLFSPGYPMPQFLIGLTGIDPNPRAPKRDQYKQSVALVSGLLFEAALLSMMFGGGVGLGYLVLCLVLEFVARLR